MVQLYDRTGQQVEIERTSFISFCDEASEVSSEVHFFNNFYPIEVQLASMFRLSYQNIEFQTGSRALSNFLIAQPAAIIPY